MHLQEATQHKPRKTMHTRSVQVMRLVRDDGCMDDDDDNAAQHCWRSVVCVARAQQYASQHWRRRIRAVRSKCAQIPLLGKPSHVWVYLFVRRSCLFFFCLFSLIKKFWRNVSSLWPAEGNFYKALYLATERMCWFLGGCGVGWSHKFCILTCFYS